MYLNKHKSFIIYIPWCGKRKTIDAGSIEDIKIVKETKYLGLILNNNLNFYSQLNIWENRVKDVKRKLYKIKFYKIQDIIAKITIWHSYMESILLYGSQCVFPFLSKSN